MAQPNVIVFFTDQQRWDTAGVHDNPMGLTPNFDRLANNGTHFANTFTCQPVCAPARASLQTGLYATNAGVWRNGLGLSPDTMTLGHYFRDAGYSTGYIGKWHLYAGQGEVTGRYGPKPTEPVPPEYRGGYDFWRGANLLEFVSDAYDMRLYDNDGIERSYPGYRVDAQTDLAIDFVSQNRAAPFFLFLSYLEPHHQNHTDAYLAPHGYAELYRDVWTPPDLQALTGSAPRQLPGYYGAIKRLDEALGRIVDATYSLGILDNTIIIYLSDHGCHFHTRIGFDKRSGHEASIRVPCMASGPGFERGGRVTNLVSLVDIPPTLLDAAGIPVPGSMEGTSLVPLVSRRTDDWRDYIFVQISESSVGRAIRTRRWKYIVAAERKQGFGSPADGAVEDADADTYIETDLYDLEHDPYELRNLAGATAYRAVADRLKERLLRRIREVEGASPRIHNAPGVPSGQSIVFDHELDL